MKLYFCFIPILKMECPQKVLYDKKNLLTFCLDVLHFYQLLSLWIDHSLAIIFMSWDKDNKFLQSVKEVIGKAKPTSKSKNQYRLGRIHWIWLPCNFVYHSHRSKEKE